MKQTTYKKRAAIHGLSMAVFIGACLGVQAGDKNASADVSVNTDSTAEVRNDSDNGKLSRGDAGFIRDAAKGGMMEVKMGQTAKDHASNAEVKAYGERLVKDHTDANKKLSEIAAQKGVNLAKDMDHGDAVKGGKMAMDWEKKSGADFDRGFIKHAIADHKKDISKFEKASRDSEDSDIKSFASQTLPTLREHQAEAERIARAIGVDVSVTESGDHADQLNTRAEAAGSPGVAVESRASSDNRVDRDAKIESDVKVKTDADPKAKVDVDVNTDKGDHKTLGVTTQPGDNKTLGVETQKGDSKTLGVQTGPGDGKTLGLNTRKDDGKFLGLIPAPGHKKAENRIDVDMDKDHANVDVKANASGGPSSSEKGTDADHKHHEASVNAEASTFAYSDLPSKVQETIKTEGGDQNVKVKKHTSKGQVTYTVTVPKEGRNRVIKIAEDGTIIKDNKK